MQLCDSLFIFFFAIRKPWHVFVFAIVGSITYEGTRFLTTSLFHAVTLSVLLSGMSVPKQIKPRRQWTARKQAATIFEKLLRGQRLSPQPSLLSLAQCLLLGESVSSLARAHACRVEKHHGVGAGDRGQRKVREPFPCIVTLPEKTKQVWPSII